MNTTKIRCTVVCIIIAVLCGGIARAEVTVSITINGTLEELAPFMEQLRELNIDINAKGQREEPLKLQMLSVTPAPEEKVLEEKAPKPKPPEPTLALMKPAVNPNVAKAGQIVRVAVKAYDKDRRIDTLSIAVVGSGVTGDLYDNGTGIDAEPNDGMWEGSIEIPGNIKPATYTLKVLAYDVNGVRITKINPDGSKDVLKSETILKITGP